MRVAEKSMRLIKGVVVVKKRPGPAYKDDEALSNFSTGARICIMDRLLLLIPPRDQPSQDFKGNLLSASQRLDERFWRDST
jgi:hypothetical protein